MSRRKLPNVTEEVAETEIVTVKVAETEEVLKKKGPQLLAFLVEIH